MLLPLRQSGQNVTMQLPVHALVDEMQWPWGWRVTNRLPCRWCPGDTRKSSGRWKSWVRLQVPGLQGCASLGPTCSYPADNHAVKSAPPSSALSADYFLLKSSQGHRSSEEGLAWVPSLSLAW